MVTAETVILDIVADPRAFNDNLARRWSLRCLDSEATEEDYPVLNILRKEHKSENKRRKKSMPVLRRYERRL